MKQINDSDYNPAMFASTAFETIITQIQHSNLNFQLQMSPFSAQISLKKSLITERTGVSRLPPPNFEPDVTNFAMKSDLDNLKLKYARVVDDRDDGVWNRVSLLGFYVFFATYPSLYQSIFLSIYLSISPSVYLSICQSI